MVKSNKILLIIIAVLLVILVSLLLGQKFWGEPKFYAVYLRTGDLYFGKLTKFPSYGLKQVYTIQVNPENQETPFTIQKFRNIFWGPEDFLKINRDQVVWVTKLNPQGQLAQLIKTNPDLLPVPGTQLPNVTPPPQGGTQPPPSVTPTQ